MRISVVCNVLSYFFLTTQHSAPYTMAGFFSRCVHFVFQLCWYVPVAHSVVSLHCDQAIFTLLFTSFSAPPLASNYESRYLKVFTVFTSFSNGLFLGMACTLFFFCLLLVRGTQMSLSISLAATQCLLYYVRK